jgi:pyruvate/2-oxoglutarate dehydrogenase complex dihydrolipoamide dehydrogenase (E3) component
MATSEYDVMVIGAGQGGGPFASACAKAGRRTALVERAHVGGTCINEGCTPTKTMTASARVAYLARRAGEYGVETGPVRVDMAAVRQRKREMVASFRSGSERSIEETDGLDLIRGTARFTRPHTVAVAGEAGDQEITADLIVIDAGTRPAMPPLPGLEEVPALD